MFIAKIKRNIFHLIFLPLVLYNSRLKDLNNKFPVYIFHHIPKCAGTSMRFVLRRWFFLYNDYLRYSYPDELSYFSQHSVNIQALRSRHCLSGHYALPETHIHKRYPEVLENQNYKTFTFIREPLEVKISLYYFEKKRGLQEGISLTQHLFKRKNYIAGVLDCKFDNYKEILDKYFFIGITEQLQISMDKLANLLNKKKIKLPVLNLSQRDSQASGLSPEIINQFKAANELDYIIYDYCKVRLRGNF